LAKSLERISSRLAAAYGDGGSPAIAEALATIVHRAKKAGIDEEVVQLRLRAWPARFALHRDSWPTCEMALADLCGYVLALSPGQQRPIARAMRSFAKWVFDHYAAAAGLAIAGASVLYGLAYANFYSALDTTPERVGLSTTQVLIASATGGFLLFALIAIGFVLMFLPMIPVEDAEKPQDPPQDMAPFSLHCTLTAVALAALVVLGFVFQAPLVWILVMIAAQLYFFKKGFVVRWRERRPVVLPRQLTFEMDNYLLLLVVVVPIALVFTGVVTVIEAGTLGEQARTGQTVRNPSLLSVEFLDVRAEPALIRVRDAAIGAMPACAQYLGASNGEVVLYDSARAETVQAPAREIELRFPRYRSSCEAPLNLGAPTVHTFEDGAVRCDRGRWRLVRDAEFHFAWWQGHDRVSGGALLDRAAVEPGAVVSCTVTASTALGSNAATSEPVAVG
jgi:hypothetical protein